MVGGAVVDEGREEVNYTFISVIASSHLNISS